MYTSLKASGMAAVRASITSLPRALPRVSSRIGSAGGTGGLSAAGQLGQRCLSAWVGAATSTGGRPINTSLVRPAIARVRAPALAHAARKASSDAADNADATDADVADAGVADADADVADAGVADADADVAEAGAVDADIAEAGAVDADVAEAGAVDADVAEAGAVDADVAEAGTADAGAADAGAADAGVDTQQSTNTGSALKYLPRHSYLYNLHVSRNAKMAPFGGYSMPITYPDQSLAESHVWTRTQASLFDVSHMVLDYFYGSGAAAYLEHVTPADISNMDEHQNKLTTLMVRDGSGGIVDDMMVTRLANPASMKVGSLPQRTHEQLLKELPYRLQRLARRQQNTRLSYLTVTNGNGRDKVKKYLDTTIEAWNDDQKKSGTNLHVWRQRINRHCMLALQGPKAEAVLSEILEPDEDTGNPIDLKSVRFGQTINGLFKIKELTTNWDEVKARMTKAGHHRSVANMTNRTGIEVRDYHLRTLITRGGYTGEDGFEIISFMSTNNPLERLAEMILAAGGGDCVRLAGLGARDSLRLEAGLCLYGNDIDETTTPVEAGLAWTVPKSRRNADAGYFGAALIARQISGEEPIERRRVGLIIEDGGAPARQGAVVRTIGGGEELGKVTSGSPSPTLGKNIAMGYVRKDSTAPGTEVEVVVREKAHKATVTKMPFVPTKYYKGAE